MRNIKSVKPQGESTNNLESGIELADCNRDDENCTNLRYNFHN